MTEVINKIKNIGLKKVESIPTGAFAAESITDIDKGKILYHGYMSWIDIQSGQDVDLDSYDELYHLDVRIYVEGIL